MSTSQDHDIFDIFDTSLSSLFSIPPIAFSASPSSFFTYTPPPGSISSRPIQLKIPQPPANIHGILQAQNVWLSSIYLADIISLGQLGTADKRVLELGAGAGLPGIVACRQGAEVISSDWGVEEILTVIQDNFERNCEQATWVVVGHQWGTEATPLLRARANHRAGERFDIILLADTIWVTEAHAALLDSLGALLNPGGTVHVAAGLHTGRGPVERFKAAAKARSMTVSSEKEVRWRLGGGWDQHFPPTDPVLEEERGVVVHFTLHIISS